MTREEARRALEDALREVAPDADLATLEADASLREELDLDSMDLLALARRLHERLGVEIPERDYARIDSLSAAVEYLVNARR